VSLFGKHFFSIEFDFVSSTNTYLNAGADWPYKEVGFVPSPHFFIYKLAFLMRSVPTRGSDPLIALYVSYLVTFIFGGPLKKKSHQDLGSQSTPVCMDSLLCFHIILYFLR
jgi:hypothetical protein